MRAEWSAKRFLNKRLEWLGKSLEKISSLPESEDYFDGGIGLVGRLMAQWAIIGLQWKGWSRDDIARRVGKNASHLTRILSGSDAVSFAELIKLVGLYNAAHIKETDRIRRAICKICWVREWSQADLAAELGVGRNMIYRYRTGKATPSAQVSDRIWELERAADISIARGCVSEWTLEQIELGRMPRVVFARRRYSFPREPAWRHRHAEGDD
jgi:transcriptional regulator with XRE-family HTH domain